MARLGVSGVGALLMIGFLIVGSAPTAEATTTIPIDITKVIHGYTLRIAGEIVIDPDNRTISGQLHITVTDPNGVVVFEKDVTFKSTWGGTCVVPFSSPDGSIRGTVTMSPTGVSLNLQPTSGGRFVELRPAQLDRLR